MTTKNSNLATPVESVGNADDVQNVTVEVNSVPEQEAEPTSNEQLIVSEADFAEEDAALDAEQAGLSLDEETAEEQAAEEVDNNDLSGKSKQELVDMFSELLENEPVQTLRKSVEAIKIAFYKLHRAEVDVARKEFEALEGEGAEFTPQVDALEVRLKDLFKVYRQRRDEYIANLDSIKEENLKIKLSIIEELKELINSDETLNNTFAKFRDLQQRWKDTGVVPQAKVKDLWETYNLHVENFYNFIKINKELRDLDLKKNYEQKLALCEQAEALMVEPSIVDAFHKLQKLHDEWRETGPVANEYKESLWERFKSASSRINKQHQEYFENLKQEQLKNLELKRELCVKTEALAEQPHTSRKEWNKSSEKLLEIQKIWRTIGFAPKKDNTRIYERFRQACDRFFEAKREFYAGVKNEMEHNLQLKQEICEAAEALQNSEDWKHATEEIIALQAKWKGVGTVSRRYADQIWKRFRSACDTFFERKAQHFASVENEYEANLQKKLALIEEMSAADIKTGGYDLIKDFQRRWTEIGFVPIKHKDSVQKRYKEAVDAMFAVLRGSERDRSMNRFKERLQSMKGAGDKRMRNERERLYNKVRQMEQDIALLENNIGFFSKSKNAEAMIADIKEKIAKSKRELQDTIEKIHLIDNRAEEVAEGKE
ncbi:MAG: DUF349 domain-containing protein [Alistipes sp.]|nr:DUF349 domain-containing protein [Alistipes sp.]